MNLFPTIADKISAHPEILLTARETAHRWIAERREPVERVREWLVLLDAAITSPEGRDRLLTLLRDDSEAARRLKDFAPLAGLLTREERREVILSCSFDH